MLTKHRLFIIPVNVIDRDYAIDEKAEKAINGFLAEDNFVYINHSITTLGMDTSRSPGTYRDIKIVVSLIYKDLSETPNQLKKLSERTKKIIRTSVEQDDTLPIPPHTTHFDKKSRLT